MKLDNETIFAIVLISIPFIITLARIIVVRRDGIEADAVVTCLDEHDSTTADGDLVTYEDVIVRYRTKEGRLVESSLVNPKCNMNIGDWVTIKYIPGKEDNPVLV